MKKSVWIQNFEGLYKIYRNGSIRSFKRSKTGIILKHKVSGQEKYFSIDLMKDGKHNYCYIHKLLGIAFVHNPNPKKFTMIIHKDGNCQNNKISNLKWIDVKGKLALSQQRVKIKLNDKGKFSSKFSKEQLPKIAKLLIRKGKIREINEVHKLLGVSHMTLYRLRKNKDFIKIMKTEAE